MTTDRIKAWARYYAKLSGLALWRGFVCWLYVLTGAGTVQAGGLVDLRTIGIAGAGWTLLGTMLASVAAALFKNQPPDPAAPAPPS